MNEIKCFAVVPLENCVYASQRNLMIFPVSNFQCSSTPALLNKCPPSFSIPLLIPDSQYSSYYPQYHQPLQMLLGKPLYLEVRLLNTPDPSLVLLVHYCVAYPRSGKAVWLLLYNGSASKHKDKKNNRHTNHNILANFLFSLLQD